MEKISVAVRFRPSTGEDASGGRHWKVEDNRISLHRPLGTPISGVSFAFDRVFEQSCKNVTVYSVLTKSIIEAAVNGFNGTAFAYGQTSSGKTYTMNGSEDDPGIIQLAVNDVFSSIEEIKEREFLIRVSYMEIYNEEINDLLAVENQKLQIHESLDRGIFVAGLREEIVNSADQVSKLLTLGEANRHFGETNMNVRSSRSHTIFRMNLVDLAGSERIAKTGADGVRLKEGKHINKSLMALGNVINKLSDSGKQRGHIPYRDSKLTRILQPALGGNAKTSIICTVAPEEIHIEETRGTLQFASRAKRITNCAQVNEILTDAALLKRQKLEIEELRRKLQGSHSEVLEQVILKQRNDMLKEGIPARQSSIDGDDEGEDDADCTLESHNSITPNLRAIPNEFVARRSNYSMVSDCSPLPETFGNKADEDMWLQMNKGCSTDLNMLQMTPSQDSQPTPFKEMPPKEELWTELNEERRRMEDLREEMRSFGLALAQRDGMLRSLYTRSKGIAGNLGARQVVLP
ncbi:unnamed protein product [Spirodela intermedia]|uniref:Kinesin motor domain-containing protein n=1 Tax=Spirodela intermedia TaxID=51605 RepID=A0A7I8JDJ8_SPIIN|nr:unnamed protein product [Spirodela intermedia]CAA6667462.1 unnamed protein product [Spirodela intermedia]